MKRNPEAWIAALIIITIEITMTLLYDVTYNINDDIMIESVLSGTFSGTPSGMCYYMGVPLSSFLALLYGWFPAIPWLGCFFVAVYSCCAWTMLVLLLKKAETRQGKMLVCGFFVLFWFAFMASGFILIHYTVTAAVCGATAVFYVAFSKDDKGEGTVLLSFAPAVLLLWLTYLIRENVFFMVLPFLGVAGICRLVREGFSKIRRYLSLIGLFVIGFIVLFGVNKLAYSGERWGTYVEYNEIRTRLYDYTTIHDSEEALAYYAEQGIKPETLMLYDSYNILLAEENEPETMACLNGYGNVYMQEKGSFLHFKESLYTYGMRLFLTEWDFPYNYLALLFYFVVACYVLRKKKYGMLMTVMLCALCRSFLWLYLIWEGRYPERVTYSLFVMEFFVLTAVFLKEWMEQNRKTGIDKLVVLCVTGMLVLAAGTAMRDLRAEYEAQIAVNQTDDVLYSYMEKHPENFYFLDVYATVYRGKDALLATDGIQNYLVLGGWMAGHPLLEDKIAGLGSKNAADAIRMQDNVYVVFREGRGMTPEEMEYVFQRDLQLEKVETLEAVDGVFHIYQAVK